MCLTRSIKTRLKTEEKVRELITEISEKAITVYKRFRKTRSGNLITPFQLCSIPANGIFTTEHFGFSWWYPGRGEINIGNGIHAYTTRAQAECRKAYDEVIIPMTIPKGTKYILGEGLEIVALTMKIKYASDRPKRKNPGRSKRKLVKK